MTMIPYGHQSINDQDEEAVRQAVRADWMTQGPKVREFEEALAAYCGARFAVVVSNGTAALHTAYAAIKLGPGDEFITSPITFAATANAGLWQGARPIFADIDIRTGNIDPVSLESKITSATKAIVPIDFTGRPADLEAVHDIAHRHAIPVIEDACQALGAEYRGKKIGSLSDFSIFSFHPVKTITTAEGGAILTNDEAAYKRMKSFVNHGVVRDDFVHSSPGAWYYEMQTLGMNYRLTDVQCALGISQLSRIAELVEHRRSVALRYDDAFRDHPHLILPPRDDSQYRSAWHLYVIRVSGTVRDKRSAIFAQLRDAGIGVQVHHIPVYLHPYYEHLGYQRGLCPHAEAFYETIISLPIYPDLTKSDQTFVIRAVLDILKKNSTGL